MTYTEKVVDDMCKKIGKAFCKIGKICVDFARNMYIYISPYEENEKRVIGGKIVNVTYHKIDWKKNFAATKEYYKNT